MNTLINLIFAIIRWIFVIVTFVCIDLPCKIILALLFIILAGLCSIFYPLIKNVEGPQWLCDAWDYTSSWKNLIAKKVYRAWSF